MNRAAISVLQVNIAGSGGERSWAGEGLQERQGMMVNVVLSGQHGLRYHHSATVMLTCQHPVLMVGPHVLLCLAGSQQGSGLRYSLCLSWVLLLEDLQSRA